MESYEIYEECLLGDETSKGSVTVKFKMNQIFPRSRVAATLT